MQHLLLVGLLWLVQCRSVVSLSSIYNAYMLLCAITLPSLFRDSFMRTSPRMVLTG
jgi:hypothetical protein